VETVGVGQSETAIADMADLFVLLVSPGGGDELQGIKRGVMELADFVIVTKADGDLEAAARRAEADYRAALHLMRPKYKALPPKVMHVSALKGLGIGEAWSEIQSFRLALVEGGHLTRLRAEQGRRWFWAEVEAVLKEAILSDGGTAAEAARAEAEVVAGKALPDAAARALLARFRRA